MQYTKEQVAEKLQTSNQWLERGTVAVYERQTAQEQQIEGTVEHNCKGFSAFDAQYLSYVARWIKSGKRLSGSHLSKTRKRMMKYSAQLTLIANGEL